jgi:hypothetical protein
VTTPVVAPVRKLIRAAFGRICVGPIGGNVGGTGVGGAWVEGIEVGVFSAESCVNAKMVAATTVPTAFGDMVGADGADPAQAAVDIKIAASTTAVPTRV